MARSTAGGERVKRTPLRETCERPTWVPLQETDFGPTVKSALPLGLGPKRFTAVADWVNTVGEKIIGVVWGRGSIESRVATSTPAESTRKWIDDHARRYVHSTVMATEELVADACIDQNDRLVPDARALRAIDDVRAILSAAHRLKVDGFDAQPILVEARRICIKNGILAPCVLLRGVRHHDDLRTMRAGKQPVFDFTWYAGRISEALRTGKASEYHNLGQVPTSPPPKPSCAHCSSNDPRSHDLLADTELWPLLRDLFAALDVKPERGTAWTETGARGVVERYRKTLHPAAWNRLLKLRKR